SALEQKFVSVAFAGRVELDHDRTVVGYSMLAGGKVRGKRHQIALNLSSHGPGLDRPGWASPGHSPSAAWGTRLPQRLENYPVLRCSRVLMVSRTTSITFSSPMQVLIIML